MSTMSKATEMKTVVGNVINTITQVKWKIISYKNELYLVELEEGDARRFIVNVVSNKVFSTRTRDDTGVNGAISFEGTNHTLDEEVMEIKALEQKYTGFALRDRICDILLCPQEGWNVVDQVENLCLIHYNDDADMDLVGHLRGTLVDIEAGVKVAESSGYTPNVKVAQLAPNVDGSIDINYDNKHNTFESGVHESGVPKMAIKPIYEGTVLRVILYKGNVYKLTHRKIRPMKSRWGNSDFFPTIFTKGGGPKDVELFDMSKNYSPWCYVFMVVDPKLLVASKQIVKSPYVVFLSHHHMYKDNVFPIEETETQLNAKFVVTDGLGQIVDRAAIIVPPVFTLEQANYHLAFGYYKNFGSQDIRTEFGEAVMLFKYDENGNVINMVKVNGLSYDYRVSIRGNDPNAYHQFFSLISHSYKSLSYYPDWVAFNEKFIIYENYDKESLKLVCQDGVMKLKLGTMSEEQKKDRSYLLRMIWLNYVVALPVGLQVDALEYYDQLIEERSKLVTWLQSKITSNEKLSPRALNIIASANQRAKSFMRTQKYKSEEFDALYNQSVKDSVRYFIDNEYGISLYSLIKSMKEQK